MIRSVRELGHRLGLDVVAEGVEDHDTTPPAHPRSVPTSCRATSSPSRSLRPVLTDYVTAPQHAPRHGAGSTSTSKATGSPRLTATGPRQRDRRRPRRHRRPDRHICDTPIALVRLVDVDRQHSPPESISTWSARSPRIINRYRAVLVPDVTTSPITDHHTGRQLGVRAVHVQPSSAPISPSTRSSSPDGNTPPTTSTAPPSSSSPSPPPSSPCHHPRPRPDQPHPPSLGNRRSQRQLRDSSSASPDPLTVSPADR